MQYDLLLLTSSVILIDYENLIFTQVDYECCARIKPADGQGALLASAQIFAEILCRQTSFTLILMLYLVSLTRFFVPHEQSTFNSAGSSLTSPDWQTIYLQLCWFISDKPGLADQEAQLDNS